MFTKSFIIFTFLIFGKTVNTQENYVAVVMEYGMSRDTGLSDYDNLIRNTRTYITHIEEASGDPIRAQIIVFPEYGLTTQNLPSNLETISTEVPDPSENATPCTPPARQRFAKHLVDLSCAASGHRIHVVVNLIEHANSPINTTIYYNTNVVLDTTGTVIARYRKINLINEDMLTAGEETAVFTTNFGVTFGLLTSSDLLFKNPAMSLMNDLRVTDLVYPNFWHTDKPFLKGLSIQDGFSKAYGVNFLASGYSSPRDGVGGAGIFLANSSVGGIRLSTAMVQDRIDAAVPIIKTRTPGSVCKENINPSPRLIGQLPHIESFGVRYENMEHYTFVDLEQHVNETSGEVCSEGSDFCCQFHISFETPLNSTSTIYKMAALFGVRELGNTTAPTIGIRNCALVACQSEDSSTCGMRPSHFNVIFSRITITTNVPSNEDTSYLPATLNDQLRPLERYAFCHGDIENDSVGYTMTRDNTDYLLTFGIFGRAYDLDGREIGRGRGVSVKAIIMLVTSLVFGIVYF